MGQKRRAEIAAGAPPELGRLRERLRSDLERLGLVAEEIAMVSHRLEPMLESFSAEQYGALIAGIAAGSGRREDVDAGRCWSDDVGDVERLMEGVREEVQKLDEGLRMLSAYVTGLRRRSQHRKGSTLH
jgi:hypothetical protein